MPLLARRAALLAAGVSLFACSSSSSPAPAGPLPDAAAPDASPAAPDAGRDASSPDAMRDAGAADTGTDADAATCALRTSGGANAVLDPTFPPVVWTPPSAEDIIQPPFLVALAPGGDFYVAVATGAVTPAVHVAHFSSSGVLDSTFGGTGVVTLPWRRPWSLIVDHTGDVIVTGDAIAESGGFDLTALHADGTPDFALTGIDPKNAPLYSGVFEQVVEAEDGFLAISIENSVIAIGRDGTVTTKAGIGASDISACRTLLANGRYMDLACTSRIFRFDRHGAAVGAFGTNGVASVPFEQFGAYPAADASIYTATTDGQMGLFLGHVLATGAVDPAFGQIGSSMPPPTLPGNFQFAASRCDGKTMILKQALDTSVGLALLGPTGTAVEDAGTVAIPRLVEDAGSFIGFAGEAHAMAPDGSILWVGGLRTSLEFARILPVR